MKRRVHLNISSDPKHPKLSCGEWVDGWQNNTGHKGSLAITEDINEITCRVCQQRIDSVLYMQESQLFADAKEGG